MSSATTDRPTVKPAAAGVAAPTATPARPPKGRLIPQYVSDREFLPAAIAIVETPPSTIAVTFMWAICAIFAAALLWAYFGQLDIYAVARGKIQVAGRSKVVQALEPGKVTAVLVKNGSQVKRGDVLLELDPTETAADVERLTRDAEAADAEAARRKTAIEAVRSGKPVPMPIKFKPNVNQYIRLREERVLTADLAQLATTQQVRLSS